jgi:hypothetical protein
MDDMGQSGGLAMMPDELLEQHRAARRQLDETLELLDRALDLREQLQWQLDLDDMVEFVAQLRRDVERRLRR